MQSIHMWQYLKYFKLSRIVLSKEIVAKLPIHGEFKGVPEAGMLLLGRRGQLFHWNPYYRLSSGNYNICILGPSGSGKSVFLQELAISMIAAGTKVFILDIGKSFKNICMLLGGEIIEFGRESKIILNPFSEFKSNISEEDRGLVISYAKNIICAMCNSKGDAIKESIIEQTITKGLDIYGSSFTISILSDLLQEIGSEAASNLALSLFSYTKSGLYGGFFDRSASTGEISFDKNMTIFEFEEIKNNSLLLSVVLQIIGMQIFMQVLTGDRSKKFMLIVDEAWMILEHSAKFLAEFARTIRKYGGSLVVCVQNYNDLTKGEYQNAILQNSSWTILLKQDEKGINSFKESEAFKDIVPLIRSISIEEGKYAEMLIYATNLKIIGRLVLDPYSKIMFSTDSEVFTQIQKLLSQGECLEKIIEKIAKEKYLDYRAQ
jgi:type-IV secretion system protein TraC